MARVSRQEKQASHLKIVTHAARLFRENGIEATSVGEIMAAAGLTHGGFYRHFRSKEDLVCAAINASFDTIITNVEHDMTKNGASTAVPTLVALYLSKSHVENPGIGCPVAAMGGEIAHGPNTYQVALECGANRFITLISKGLSEDPPLANLKATGLMATLIGAVIMARSTPTESQRVTILNAAKHTVKTCYLTGI